MTMTLRSEWPALDASKSKNERDTLIGAGTHEVELIPNPYGHAGNWIVLKGTKIGGSEGSWRQWTDRDDKFQVTIEE
jgi:hypothetical protein